MAEVTLSNAVRNNLLSLQKTADLLGKTQQRLSTGLKVNSALDDPTAFFTASSLNSRAGDLGRLLDSASNGIQTIEQADNGLTAITTTVESLQATINQAKTDASFQSTSYSIDDTAIGTASDKNISFSGGSVGGTAVDIAVNSTSVQSGVAGGGAYTAAVSAADPVVATESVVTAAAVFEDINLSGDNDNTLTFDITLGATTKNITIAFGDGTASVVDIDEAILAIQADLDAATALDVTVGKDGSGHLTFTADTAGATALVVDNVSVQGTTPHADLDVDVLGITDAATTGQTDTGLATAAGVTADEISFTISDGTTTTATITLGTANGGDVDLAITAINAALTTAGISLTDVALSKTGSTLSIAGLANGSNSITVGGISDGDAAQLFGVTDGAALTAATTAGVEGAVKTVDELVTTINADTGLTGKVKASNDNGKLRIENISLADLTLTGFDSAAGTVDGDTGTDTVSGNTKRQDLVNSFNTLRTELNSLAADSGYNGVNLLLDDNLKLNLNESGSSNINIQAKDESGAARAISTTTLEIDTATDAEFGSNVSLETRSGELSTALQTLRTQASQFGTSLAIVQNRQDFTKNVINTLETGAANLTLADTNLEGANLLALQTRQQLSSTALSLASQADQNVLRLF